ncbi:MAG: hypothetical protein P8M22_06430 [Phycisphaerales bacterium]|nr:hypothetical protein [Phycisphaerales bacterium]
MEGAFFDAAILMVIFFLEAAFLAGAFFLATAFLVAVFFVVAFFLTARRPVDRDVVPVLRFAFLLLVFFLATLDTLSRPKALSNEHLHTLGGL